MSVLNITSIMYTTPVNIMKAYTAVMETVSPTYQETLDSLSESLRVHRRAAYLLQLSDQPPVPAELSLPQLMAEIV
jgi:hypothetical protein